MIGFDDVFTAGATKEEIVNSIINLLNKKELV